MYDSVLKGSMPTEETSPWQLTSGEHHVFHAAGCMYVGVFSGEQSNVPPVMMWPGRNIDIPLLSPRDQLWRNKPTLFLDVPLGEDALTKKKPSSPMEKTL